MGSRVKFGFGRPRIMYDFSGKNMGFEEDTPIDVPGMYRNSGGIDSSHLQAGGVGAWYDSGVPNILWLLSSVFNPSESLFGNGNLGAKQRWFNPQHNDDSNGGNSHIASAVGPDALMGFPHSVLRHKYPHTFLHMRANGSNANHVFQDITPDNNFILGDTYYFHAMVCNSSAATGTIEIAMQARNSVGATSTDGTATIIYNGLGQSGDSVFSDQLGKVWVPLWVSLPISGVDTVEIRCGIVSKWNSDTRVDFTRFGRCVDFSAAGLRRLDADIRFRFGYDTTGRATHTVGYDRPYAEVRVDFPRLTIGSTAWRQYSNWINFITTKPASFAFWENHQHNEAVRYMFDECVLADRFNDVTALRGGYIIRPRHTLLVPTDVPLQAALAPDLNPSVGEGFTPGLAFPPV